MEITSIAKYIRLSPRKLRLLSAQLRNLPVLEAQDYLALLPFKGAKLLQGALETASADAIHNFKKAKKDLRIKNIQIFEGPRLKRYQPISRGAAHPYKRRFSHIQVVLSAE